MLPGTRRLYARRVEPVLVKDYLGLLADAPGGASRVLDVGCGPGDLLAALARRWPEVRFDGVDADPGQVRLARARHGGAARFRHARGRRMPFDDGVFDLALATESLHHWRRPVRTLEEVHRVLRPGGRLVALEGRGDETWADVRRRLGTPFPLVPFMPLVYRRRGYGEEAIEQHVRPCFAGSPFGGCTVAPCGRWWRIEALRGTAPVPPRGPRDAPGPLEGRS